MLKSRVSMACLILAIGMLGCQEQVSSDSDATGAVGTAGTQNESKVIPAATHLKQAESTVIAYYFHRTVRCRTCLAIETNAARVIENKFSQQITNGQLTWMPYNLDDPGGKDLEKEFDVSVSTLVLAKMQDGKHTKYKKLEQVWDYVSDPVKFDTYIEDQVRRFLNE